MNLLCKIDVGIKAKGDLLRLIQSEIDHKEQTMPTTTEQEVPSEFTPVPWYLVENFPFTRCYVSDFHTSPCRGHNVEFIAEYRSEGSRKFIDQDGTRWRHAVPVTRE
jgi:hypothetical protein